MPKWSTLSLGFFLWFLLLASPTLTLAQATADTATRQAALQAELNQVEQEIADQTALLQAKQKETATIQRDIDILTYQINQAKLIIKQKQIQIQQLGSDIGKKQDTIVVLGHRLTNEEESLAELLRKTRQLDDVTLLEVTFADDDLSSILADLNSFNSLQEAMHQSFTTLRDTRTQTESEKNVLEKKQSAEEDAKKKIEEENNRIAQIEKDKQVLLKASKNTEATYKSVLAQKESERAAIRSALFRLQGATSISFGQAYDLAKALQPKTGIRPAFLLAIVTQESNLGNNVGTCNRSGDPPSKSWQSIMKPGRDDGPFLQIVKELGLDPNTVPLSCPQGGGWGGAMGPAQFIPSTWLLFKDRISALTGNNPPNPWAPQDAFAASSLLLEDLGASNGGYSAEQKAAAKYYAGGRWATAGQSYANSVMAIASGYQHQIDTLQNL